MPSALLFNSQTTLGWWALRIVKMAGPSLLKQRQDCAVSVSLYSWPVYISHVAGTCARAREGEISCAICYESSHRFTLLHCGRRRSRVRDSCSGGGERKALGSAKWDGDILHCQQSLKSQHGKKSLMDSERILHCSLCRSAVYARRPLVLFALSYSTLSLQLRLKLIVAFVFFGRCRLISRRHLCAAAPHLYVDRVRSIQ